MEQVPQGSVRDVLWELLLPCQDWQSSFGCSRVTQAHWSAADHGQLGWSSPARPLSRALMGFSRHHITAESVRLVCSSLAGEQGEQSLSGVFHRSW